mmetsp:Transcript_16627/g.27260  ORF Transcript_16627/g.27260 Transcript_16627/m.27260 type:complete len:338 (+) Transcript_16627:46-1059(+)
MYKELDSVADVVADGDVAAEDLEGGAVEETVALDVLGDDLVGLATDGVVTSKDGDREGAGTEDVEGVGEDGGVVLGDEVGLVRHEAEASLGGDVDGGVGVVKVAVHAVATRGEEVLLDERVGEDLGDASVDGDLLGIGLDGVVALEEGGHGRGVEIAHHDLDGLLAGRKGVGTSDVDMPVVASEGAEDMGRAVGEELVEGVDLSLEAAVGVVLTVGPAVVLAREDDAVKLEFELRGILEEFGQTGEETGGAAGLDHELGRVHKQTRLGEDVRVKVLVAVAAEDDGLDERQELVPLLALDIAHAVGPVGVGLELDRETLLWSFKAMWLFVAFDGDSIA